MDEDFNSLVMECNNCHLKFRATELKIDPLKNALVCSNCLAFPGSKVMIIKDDSIRKKRPEVKTEIIPERKPITQAKPLLQNKTEQKKDMDEIPEGYKAFKCSHCNYKFTRKNNWQGNCPYCAKNTAKPLK